MGSYDVAQYCRSGHEITQSYNERPEERSNFCIQCGAPTVTTCDRCSATIMGMYRGRTYVLDSPRPNHCHNCGKAHSWVGEKLAAGHELIALLDELSPAEKADLERSLEDIVSNGPRTELGVARLKRLLAKAGKGAGEMVYKVAIDLASETAKKYLAP